MAAFPFFGFGGSLSRGQFCVSRVAPIERADRGKLFQPESERQLLELLRWASQAKQKARAGRVAPVLVSMEPDISFFSFFLGGRGVLSFLFFFFSAISSIIIELLL